MWEGPLKDGIGWLGITNSGKVVQSGTREGRRHSFAVLESVKCVLQDIDKLGIRSKRKPHNDEKQFPEQQEGNFVGWPALNHPAVPVSITYLGGEESVGLFSLSLLGGRVKVLTGPFVQEISGPFQVTVELSPILASGRKVLDRATCFCGWWDSPGWTGTALPRRSFQFYVGACLK